jgi:hypothetical protein
MMAQAKSRAHAMAATLLAGGAVLYAFAPSEHAFYPRCIFHALTGWQCPGCGGTRALYHLLHFHLGEAMQYNALVTLLAPLALAYFIFWYGTVLRSGSGPSLRLPRLAIVCLYVAVLLFGAARNISFSFLS